MTLQDRRREASRRIAIELTERDRRVRTRRAIEEWRAMPGNVVQIRGRGL